MELIYAEDAKKVRFWGSGGWMGRCGVIQFEKVVGMGKIKKCIGICRWGMLGRR